MAALDKFRGEYFMSLAPVYLIASSYLMQAALKNPSIVTYALSVFTMLCAIWSAIVAFAFNKLPKEVAYYTYQILASLALIGTVVFIIGWLGTLNELLNLKASPAYVYAYFGLGLLLFFVILGFNVYQAFKQVC